MHFSSFEKETGPDMYSTKHTQPQSDRQKARGQLSRCGEPERSILSIVQDVWLTWQRHAQTILYGFWYFSRLPAS